MNGLRGVEERTGREMAPRTRIGIDYTLRHPRDCATIASVGLRDSIRCRLTQRSSRPVPAWRLARFVGWFIIPPRAKRHAGAGGSARTLGPLRCRR
jgi:hypothetical protein